ncbi:hypothetical protein CEE39_06700 [bacterium (candidate division B38) B3_B38]|nr:MAG: hypothetical protein CEE39_06700 [bacterium (candidate division B38) B3_B38]
MDIADYLKEKKRVVDAYLERALPGEDEYPPVIYQAMRYTIFSGGKRLRPILTIAACEALGKDEERALPAACAMELIHNYSLIHDDLPFIDDDELRRGKPTAHKVYGSAIALLAGDALLTLGFHQLAAMPPVDGDDSRNLLIIKEISEAAGTRGMIGGQVIDLQSEGEKVGVEVLNYIHSAKTGALLTTCLRVGGLLANASSDEMLNLTRYGRSMGLAFQIVDDILDVEGDERLTGKTTGKDAVRGKATYPAVVGMKRSKEMVEELLREAVAAAELLPRKGGMLPPIAHFITKRRL